MSGVVELRGSVRNNAWGSRSLLTELFGFHNPEGVPQAEFWMGVHARAPSTVRVGNEWIALRDWIAEDPEARLGTASVGAFGSELPFLFKILAADEPLSLQAHPDPDQARVGFDAENRGGKDIADPTRNYRDPGAKPELLCALTPFDALLGFRDLAQMHELLSALELPELDRRLDRLHEGTTEGLRTFFAALLQESESARANIAREVTARCSAMPDHPARRWVIEIAKRYPDDICVLAPLLLNVIRLDPGQAVFLPPGELHCYLEGCGVEIMSSSDNVLRCGLTGSHVDIEALLGILTFSHGDARVVEPTEVRPGEWTYTTPAREFELSRVDVSDRHVVAPSGSIEILLLSEGTARISCPPGAAEIEVARGSSLVVSADAGPYEVRGRCSFFRATVPTR